MTTITATPSSPQSFTIPDGVYSLSLAITGGSGAGTSGIAGAGIGITCTVAVQPGDQYQLIAGGGGGNPSGTGASGTGGGGGAGQHSGGAGGRGYQYGGTNYAGGYGGGGSSALVKTGVAVIAEAAGGGGAGSNHYNYGGSAGAGGVAANRGGGQGSGAAYQGGGAATATTEGVGGGDTYAGDPPAPGGSSGNGGPGFNGGGGGGGLHGGGGGGSYGSATAYTGGGGGGFGLISSACSSLGYHSGAYGNGTASVTYYVPPSAPTLVSPADQSTTDGTAPITFSWTNGQTNEPNDTVTGVQIGFTPSGGTETVVNVTGAATTYTAAANYFPPNRAVSWRVRTNSNAGTGVWSAPRTVTPTQTYFAPSAPTLSTPAAAAVVDAAQTITLTAVYNSNDNTNETAYALRVKLGSGAYQYFNATSGALQSAAVWNQLAGPVIPGGTLSVAVPAGVLANGNSYVWSLATQSASGGQQLQGPFAADRGFTTQAGPTVTVTAPSGAAVASSQPATTWTETLTGSGSQTNYEVVWESGAPGVSPGYGTPLFDTGVVSSAAKTASPPGQLPNGQQVRTFVRITQTSGQQSGWAYSDFTVALPVPAAPTLTGVATTDPVTGLPVAQLLVTGADSGPNYTATNTVFEVQRSVDGGVTWADLAASPYTPAANDTATVVDYEAPFGGATLYQARAIGTATAGLYGPWSVALPLTIYSTSYWTVDPLNPSTAVSVPLVGPIADVTYGIDQDVTVTIGSAEPVVESDVRQDGAGAYQWVASPPQRTALVALLNSGAVLLQRGPNERAYYGEWEYFVPVGTLTVGRLASGLHARRLVSTSWVQRTAP